MPTNIRRVILELIVQFPGRGFSEEDFEIYQTVTRYHLKRSELHLVRQHTYLGATWASNEDDYINRLPCPFLYDEKEEFSLSAQDQRGDH